MPTSPDCLKAVEYSRANRQTALDGLVDLLRYATISSQYPANQAEFEKCSEWLATRLVKMGFTQAQVLPTREGGAPAVYAEWKGAGEAAPTLLVYGHYDVMPVDPLEEWRRPPFEPQIDDRAIYARGASDDKGQVFAILCAAEAWLKGSGSLPVNLKVLIEGEEEMLSPHLEALLVEKRDLLRCDGIVIADIGGLGPEVPLVEYGNRGNCPMEISVSGPSKDLHSGTYGGAVDNPFNVLARLLAALQDGETRKITIAGFYDKVKEMTTQQRQYLAAMPVTDEVGLYLTGAPALGGEQGYPLKERVSSRPDFEIHGITGGYTGPGIKTVIPAMATAKISFRLVPDQDPDEVFQMVKNYLTRLAPPTVCLSFTLLGKSYPATMDLNDPVVVASDEAYRRVWGVSPVFIRGGGSEPVVYMLQQPTNPAILMTGFGLPDDREHSPNENFELRQFYNGIEMMINYFAVYAALAKGASLF